MIRTLIFILLIFIGVILGLGVYLQPNDFKTCRVGESLNDCQKADAVVVLSGGDTTARTDAGIEIYKQGLASKLILAGAAEDTTGPSNAAVMKARALNKAVPVRDIFTDEKSRNTKENAINVAALLKAQSIDSIILVTSGYHQKRASLEFGQAVQVLVFNYPINDKDWSDWWWLTPKGWYLAISEFVKTIAVYVRGSSE